jgi:hypothetical protein
MKDVDYDTFLKYCFPIFKRKQTPKNNIVRFLTAEEPTKLALELQNVFKA